MRKFKVFLLMLCTALALSGCTSKESIKELEEQNKILIEENKSLKEQIAGLETEFYELKKDNADLFAKLEKLSAENSKKDDNSFVTCVFDKENDQIILSNESESYKLSICLYGTQIEPGEYQVFGSDKETILDLNKQYSIRFTLKNIYDKPLSLELYASGYKERHNILFEPSSCISFCAYFSSQTKTK